MAATIRDVARQAGVSTATVSRVLAGKSGVRPGTVARVTDAVEALDYRPSGVARSLKRRTTRTLGLVVTDILNPFYPEVVRAVEAAARMRGYSVILCNGDEDPEREARSLELLLERRVDGIIIASSRLTSRHVRWLERAPIPVVAVNSVPSVAGIPAILSDNVAGGRIAASHLAGLGHEAIGYITAPETNAAVSERLEGARRGLAAAGVEARRMPVVVGDGHVAGGERAAHELFGSHADLSALLCHNDLTAIGAIRAVRARGRRVPGDVSVVGFDDIDLAAYVEPALTTVVQEKAEMGRWAVETLAAHLAGQDGGSDDPVVRLPVSLRVRASTAPPGPRSLRDRRADAGRSVSRPEHAGSASGPGDGPTQRRTG
ncbi:MAG TPA: LacI family DNA-binding transcriptional regulator [Candidatus Limnocylindrales bacterium]|nr:LacI family DNA-binding transcriptional regulator [Candidatus Limnocylindrales bacterium]